MVKNAKFDGYRSLRKIVTNKTKITSQFHIWLSDTVILPCLGKTFGSKW